MLLHQLPPHGFWFWYCNGFQVYDALVVALWMALNMLYMEQKTGFMFGAYKCALATTSFHTDVLSLTLGVALACKPGKTGDAAGVLGALQGYSLVTTMAACPPCRRSTWEGAPSISLCVKCCSVHTCPSSL